MLHCQNAIVKKVQQKPGYKLHTYLQSKADSQYERSDTGDESREEGVERECAHHATVEELNDTGEENVGQIGVDYFQPLGSVVSVLVGEFCHHIGEGGGTASGSTDCKLRSCVCLSTYKGGGLQCLLYR